jgi:P-type E1-E2 ATPase
VSHDEARRLRVEERTNRRREGDDAEADVSSPGAAPQRHDGHADTVRTDLFRIGLICIAAGLLRAGIWDALGHPTLVGLTATLIGGYSIFKDGLKSLIQRRMTMAVSVTIAIVAALVIGEVFTALVITACVLAAGVVEGLAVSRGRAALRRLLDPPHVRVRRDGRPIDPVYRIERRRAPIQHTADRLAASLGYITLAAAVVTFLVTRDMRFVIAVLIVAGTRGVTASTPLAILGAIGRAARSGAIIKGGIHLEALWSIDTVVLDQAGTVTFGDVRVTTIYPVTGVSVREVLEAASIAECRSEHPIGRAIIRYAVEKRIQQREPRGFTSTPGEGVRALDGAEEILVGSSGFVTAGRLPEPPADGSGSKTVFVVRGGRYLGSVAVANLPRPEAKRAIADLRELAVKTLLLTGDSGAAVERMARDLAVDDFETGLMPDAKRLRVQLLAKTHRVAVVGDGVDDRLVLVAATVGVAMGSGPDVARDGADIVLLGNDLLKFVDTLRLARRTHAIIFQNFAGTAIVDGVGIGLAAIGVVTPVMAAAIHVTSALAFILNSARLVPPR